jgi:UDP-2-acetamido-3-amino-2,3-dideoxy-glucuronate N-acetyltransferase
MVHPTAEVSPRARIGPRTRVWNYTQIRDEASVGDECVIGRNVYVDEGVVIGNRVKVQNNALLYRGVRLEDGYSSGQRPPSPTTGTPARSTPMVACRAPTTGPSPPPPFVTARRWAPAP